MKYTGDYEKDIAITNQNHLDLYSKLQEYYTTERFLTESEATAICNAMVVINKRLAKELQGDS